MKKVYQFTLFSDFYLLQKKYRKLCIQMSTSVVIIAQNRAWYNILNRITNKYSIIALSNSISQTGIITHSIPKWNKTMIRSVLELSEQTSVDSRWMPALCRIFSILYLTCLYISGQWYPNSTPEAHKKLFTIYWNYFLILLLWKCESRFWHLKPNTSDSICQKNRYTLYISLVINVNVTIFKSITIFLFFHNFL